MKIPEAGKVYKELKALEARVEALENPKKTSKRKAKRKAKKK